MSKRNSGQFRKKRGDTLIRSVEQRYNVDFNVRSDMKLSTYLEEWPSFTWKSIGKSGRKSEEKINMVPTETDVFWENIHWNIDQIAVQQAQAEKVNGRAKSGYYKAAILLASSVVEALAYKLLEQEIARLPEDRLPLQDWECFESKIF